MPRINEATDTDLKVIEELAKLGWKRGDTLLYQQEKETRPLRERAGVRGQKSEGVHKEGREKAIV